MKCYNITYFRLSQVLRWSKVSAEFGAASTGAQVPAAKQVLQPRHHGPKPSWWAKAYHPRISPVQDHKPWMVGLDQP